MSTLTAARVGFGGVCLAAPDAVPGLSHPLDTRMRWFLRILGGRQLIQAWFVGAAPTAARHRIGGGIDIVHAATMVMWATTDRRHRRPALANAAVALAFACAEVRSARPTVAANLR